MADLVNIPLDKKVDCIVKTYITKCTNKSLYKHGVLNPEYYRMRNHVKNKKDFPIQACFEYALKVTEKQHMTFTDFINQAEKYRLHLWDMWNEKQRAETLAKFDCKKEYSLSDLDKFFDNQEEI